MIPATDFESVPGDDGITSSDDALEEGAEAGGPAITRTFGINRSESSSFGLWVAVFIFVLVVALIYTPVIYLFFRSPAQVVIILWLSVIVPLVCIPLFGFIPSSVEANRWCKCALLGMVGGLLSVLFFVAATVGLFIAILWVFTELNINETTSWIAVFLALPWLSTLTCGVLQVVVMGWVIEGLIRPHKDGSIDSRWKLYNRLSGASYGTAVGYGFSFGYFFLLPVINIAVALISENSYQTPLSYVRSFHFLSTMSSPVYNSCWMFLTSLIGAYLGWKFGLLAYPGQRPSSSIQVGSAWFS